jgi:SAM-dependent methyltransferase
VSLTDAEFWDHYWNSCQLPSTIDPAFSFDRCLAAALRPYLRGRRGDVLEIGCAPGKWLAWLAAEFGLKPSGIDYSPVGVEATRRNFAMLGIEPGFIGFGDFLAMEPRCSFDVVMSLGFIEHFDQPEAVLARHLAWLRPEGLLMIGVPNFLGIYRILQQYLDKTILDKHNQHVMMVDFFKRFAEHHNLDLLFVDHIGSFEPALPVAQIGIHNPQEFLVKAFLRVAAKIRQIPVLDRINHPFFSSYLLAIFQK